MNQSIIGIMRKIVRENNFEINDDINSEYLCTICRKILIDSCNNARCGCRYCKVCIKEYLKEERKVCPGESEYCKSEVINIDTDIQIDQPINIKISRIKVKCPNESCQMKFELKSIEDHLRICKPKSFDCLYKNLGCEEDTLTNERVNEHLLTEIHKHTRLLMEWISNSQNDVESLKKRIDQLSQDNNDLKGKMKIDEERTQNIIGELRKVEKENTLEIYNLGDEMSALKNDNRFLKEELRTIKKQITENISISELKIKIEKQDKEFEQLIYEMNSMRNENILLKEEMRQIRNGEISHLQFNTKLEKQRKEIEQFKQKFYERINDQQKKSNKIDSKLDEISNIIEVKSNNTIESLENMRELVDESNHENFIWKIDNWLEKRNQAQNNTNTTIYSNNFFSHKNGYKMCLQLWPDGFLDGKGTHLSVFFCIKRGPFDGILKWPFKNNVELSLINQQSCLVQVKSATEYSDDPDLRHIFQKPINDRNMSFGFPRFIKLDEIFSNHELSRNNQIFIKCSVKPLR